MITKNYFLKQILAFLFVLTMTYTTAHANTNSSEVPFGGLLNYQNLVLTPGSNESQRRFTWYTDQPGSWIAFRVQGSNTYEIVQAENSTTDARSGQFIHRATIHGLTPSTIYEYMLLGANGFQSPVYTFRTLDPNDFSFFIVGDIQIGAGGVSQDTLAWVRTMNMASAHFPNAGMILSAGDQVHQGGSVSAFDGLFSPHQLSRLPFAPTVGNHDSNVRFFPNHFNLPNVTPFGTGATQMNYWFRYGSALFIVLNSNTTDIEAHRGFLQSTINSNLDATWRVVMFHHGPYTEFRAQHYAPKVAIRNYWIPVFDSLGIDIVLNGHCHVYNRTFHMVGNEPRTNQIWLDEGGDFRHDPTGLLHNTVLDPIGTVYFTFNSSTGNRFYSLAGRQPRFFTANRNQAYLPNFSVANITDNSFSITTYQLNSDNTITAIDSYTILKTT
ncbi:MAG: metallophosphoesterase family protein [Defluviitaleaceae bacterium]|nr:metallophosphoesterase family protein [Defluviitaleaceae bacterium]